MVSRDTDNADNVSGIVVQKCRVGELEDICRADTEVRNVISGAWPKNTRRSVQKAKKETKKVEKGVDKVVREVIEYGTQTREAKAERVSVKREYHGSARDNAPKKL